MTTAIFTLVVLGSACGSPESVTPVVSSEQASAVEGSELSGVELDVRRDPG